MSGLKMHADEIEVTVSLVARLIAGQYPQWVGLPIRPVASPGTVNAIFRLGEDMAVRLPRVPWGTDDVITERRWLPQLAPYLPVAIPALIGDGHPTEEYPWPWSVLGWLDGANPKAGHLAAPGELGADLAEFIRAFRKIDLADGPVAYRADRFSGRYRRRRRYLDTQPRPGAVDGRD